MRNTMNDAVQLTILTPAYNRAALLPACFQSLCGQTDFDFEWLIVDDGSTDDTEAVVGSFQTDRFPIRYIKKPNGGKHTALNAAHPHIRGRYVLILDSDDTLTADAVEQTRRAWADWADDPEIGIVTFLKGSSPDDPNCVVSDWNTPVDIMCYRRTCIHSNDCCEVIRTELFKKYPFPVFPGERFLAEGALWGRVSYDCKCVYIQRVIYLCEYLDGGLTKSGRAMRIRNPLGGMYHANVYLAKKNFFKLRVKNGLLYTCYGFFAGRSPRQMAESCQARALMWLCLPFGWALYRMWKRKYGK